MLQEFFLQMRAEARMGTWFVCLVVFVGCMYVRVWICPPHRPNQYPCPPVPYHTTPPITGKSMPITTRQLESLIRLSQARAKAELREVVTQVRA